MTEPRRRQRGGAKSGKAKPHEFIISRDAESTVLK